MSGWAAPSSAPGAERPRRNRAGISARLHASRATMRPRMQRCMASWSPRLERCDASIQLLRSSRVRSKRCPARRASCFRYCNCVRPLPARTGWTWLIPAVVDRNRLRQCPSASPRPERSGEPGSSQPRCLPGCAGRAGSRIDAGAPSGTTGGGYRFLSTAAGITSPKTGPAPSAKVAGLAPWKYAAATMRRWISAMPVSINRLGWNRLPSFSISTVRISPPNRRCPETGDDGWPSNGQDRNCLSVQPQGAVG